MGFWAVAGPALASVVGGAASGAIERATAKGGEVGYDLPTMTPSPYDATNQRLMAEIAQQRALNYQQGKLDPGMQVLLDQIRKRLLEQSKLDMYGRPGQRGGSIMDNTMAMGAMGDVGPKAMMAGGSRAMQDYAQRNSQIMNYIDQLEFSGLQGMGDKAWEMMKGQPRSSEIPWTGGTVEYNVPGQEGYKTGLGDVDWFDAYKSIAGETKPKANPLLAQYGKLTGRTANYVKPMTLGGQKGTLVGHDTSKDYYPPAR